MAGSCHVKLEYVAALALAAAWHWSTAVKLPKYLQHSVSLPGTARPYTLFWLGYSRHPVAILCGFHAAAGMDSGTPPQVAPPISSATIRP